MQGHGSAYTENVGSNLVQGVDAYLYFSVVFSCPGTDILWVDPRSHMILLNV
jgi:hypothetical protein